MRQIVFFLLLGCTGVLCSPEAIFAQTPHSSDVSHERDPNHPKNLLQGYLKSLGRDRLIAHVNTNRPMAYQDEHGVWMGLEVGQVRAVCEMIGVTVQFQPIPDPNDRFASLRNGTADLVLGGLSITPGRMESGLAFSQTTLNANLCTVGPWSKGTALGEGLFSIIYATIDGKTLLMFLIVFPMAVKVVRSCRHQPQVPSIKLGLLLTCLVYLFGIFFLCVTQDRVQQVEVILDYFSEDDLTGRRVATKANTTSEKVADKKGAILKPQHRTDSFEEAFALLQDKRSKVEFVIADFPVAAHYVNKGDGKGRAIIVGPHYSPQNYGVAFQAGNPLIRPFNIALLKVQQSDMFDELTRAYLGDANRSQ